MVSEWTKFYPEKWKSHLVDGKQLQFHSFETRRACQRFPRNSQDEQAALDASLIVEIMERLHHDIEDFAGKQCGDITSLASKL
jgi:hypothetical protein